MLHADGHVHEREDDEQEAVVADAAAAPDEREKHAVHEHAQDCRGTIIDSDTGWEDPRRVFRTTVLLLNLSERSFFYPTDFETHSPVQQWWNGIVTF